jgi:chloramphenicol-sensitive protein RarD
LLSAVLAFVSWGLVAIYWKQIHRLPADAILANRMLWCAVFAGFLITRRGEWGVIRAAFRSPRTLAFGFLCGVVISVNWIVFIWAINAGRVLETSLGYFLNPLVNIVAGTLFFREKLRPAQWFAVALAASGVGYLTWHTGGLPWVSLSLCGSFAIYGVLHKLTPSNPVPGLFLETALMTGPALIYSWVILPHPLGVPDPTLREWLFTIGSGVVTAMPLVWFAQATRALPLSTLGFLQYLAPSLSFLLGVFWYHEPFHHDRFVAFGFIWAGLVVFTSENRWQARLSQKSRAEVLPALE